MKKATIQTIIILLLILSNVFFILHPFYEKEEIEEKEIVDTLTSHVPRYEIDSLAKMAINEGDTVAYKEFAVGLMRNMKWHKLYYYSFIMANKYNNKDAFNILYEILNMDLEINGVKFHSEDEITQSYAKYFLLKSYELGYKDAIYAIENEFGEGAEFPNSSYYLYKILGDTVSVTN